MAVIYSFTGTYAKRSLIQEQTIRSAVECSGIGLHSGAPVCMRILPAPPGTGIVFRRIDLGWLRGRSQQPQRRPRQLRHQPDEKGRADLHHRAPALRLHRPGRGQRHRGTGQSRTPHPRRQRSAVRRADSEGRHSQAAPAAPLYEDSSRSGDARRQQVYLGLSRRQLLRLLLDQFSASRSSARKLFRSSFQTAATCARSRRPALSARAKTRKPCATWG